LTSSTPCLRYVLFAHQPFAFSFSCYYKSAYLDSFVDLQTHQFLVSRPPLPVEGPIPADLVAAASEAPKAEEI
jgi:hypothetical protein